jgi:hypothetical protein
MIDINSTKWEKTVQHLANDGINQFTIAYTKSLPTPRVNNKYTPLELFNILFYPNRYNNTDGRACDLYRYRLYAHPTDTKQTDDFVQTKKLLLLK